MSSPRISVIMPMYNVQRFIKEAVDSVLNQTYKDLELIIIDDGSSDLSLDIVRAYTDPRMKIYVNEHNLGAGMTRNRGIELAQGEYIAFLDSDDMSTLDRLEKQCVFLDQNPNIDMCSAAVMNIDQYGNNIVKYSLPLTHKEIEVNILFGCPIVQGIMMFRRERFLATGLKYRNCIAEDIELFSRLLEKGFLFANLPDYMLFYRRWEDQTSTKLFAEQSACAKEVFRKEFKAFGMELTDRELDIHTSFSLTLLDPQVTAREIGVYSELSRRIVRHNLAIKRYDDIALRRNLYIVFRNANRRFYSKARCKINTFLFRNRLNLISGKCQN